MTLGEKLKMLRASRGLSQEQLAAELNVSRQAVSKWECGDAAPDLDKLRAICTYFVVTTDYLIWENEEDAPKAAVPEKERASRGRNEVFSNVLLLVLLLTGVVRVDHIREKSDFLLGNLGFFFIPVSVSIMNYVDLLWQHAAAFLTVCVVSMVLTYGATVWAVRLTQRLMDRGGKRK